jgi:DNA-binding CsgD family transcriptional regulator
LKRAINSIPLAALTPLTRRQADLIGWIDAGKRNGEIVVILAISLQI